MKKIITADEIKNRIQELAREIEDFYQGKDNFSAIILLNGAIFFACDLLKKINHNMVVDTLAVASYDGTQSTNKISFRSAPKLSVKEKDVLLIDDIFDTGLTVTEVKKYLLEEGANSVEICCLLNKEDVTKKTTEVPLWIGFNIKNLFVVGYGLDCDEKYRNLEDIYVWE